MSKKKPPPKGKYFGDLFEEHFGFKDKPFPNRSSVILEKNMPSRYKTYRDE
jgi:hypothetical protein